MPKLNTPRALRSDSASAAVNAMVNAAKPLPELPKHVTLRKGDEPFWEGVLRARARDEWTESDLVVGAQLARCQRDIEDEQIALDAEGSVVENRRGTMVANARFMVLQQLAQREMMLLRALRIAGAVPATEDLNNKRGLERAAGRLRDQVQDEDESLLA
jgi:hypothetical protein